MSAQHQDGLDRRRRIGKIHQGKKALNLGEQEYRALLQRASDGVDGLDGVASSALMTQAQHIAVLRVMAAEGFKDAAPDSGKRKRWPGEPKECNTRPLLRKVRALLASGKKPWAYAHEMAKHMYGVDLVEWLNDHDLHGLVAAMQKDANRKGK